MSVSLKETQEHLPSSIVIFEKGADDQLMIEQALNVVNS